MVSDYKVEQDAPPLGTRVPPLVARIADALTRDIVDGRYKPGARVREQEVADRFGTSRAPVREAIRLLEIEGLIQTEHWRGARVVAMTDAEIEDLFEVISAIFGLVARLAARHGSRADFQKFDLAVRSMDERHSEHASGESRVLAAFEAAKVLREACASPIAGEMLRKLARLAFVQHRLVQDADQAWQAEALSHWHDLAEAVAGRDDDGAEAIARQIIRQTRDFTMSRLRLATTRAPGAAPNERVAPVRNAV